MRERRGNWGEMRTNQKITRGRDGSKERKRKGKEKKERTKGGDE